MGGRQQVARHGPIGLGLSLKHLFMFLGLSYFQSRQNYPELKHDENLNMMNECSVEHMQDRGMRRTV